MECKKHSKQITRIGTFSIQIQYSIALITETWLKPKKSAYIKGYKCVRSDRINVEGGGVATFIRENLKFEVENKY